MKKSHPLKLDLSDHIKKIDSFKISQSGSFDKFLMNLVNKIYVTYDFLIDEMPGYIKSLSIENAEETYNDLKRINDQTNQLYNILSNIEYDTKNMDRAFCMLEDNISYSKKYMKSIEKNKLIKI